MKSKLVILCISVFILCGCPKVQTDPTIEYENLLEELVGVCDGIEDECIETIGEELSR